MLIVYQGWASIVDDKTYNTDRIWGKMDPNPAIAELKEAEVRKTNNGATIVNGVLFLPEAAGHKPQATSLLDISGRKMLDLAPGANDVRALAPGVYFVVAPSPSSSSPEGDRVGVRRRSASVAKVVVTR